MHISGDMQAVYGMGFSNFVEKAIEQAVAKERERCVRIVETEEELEGDPPQYVIDVMLAAGPVENARAAVRATKSCIARRIREA